MLAVDLGVCELVWVRQNISLGLSICLWSGQELDFLDKGQMDDGIRDGCHSGSGSSLASDWPQLGVERMKLKT